MNRFQKRISILGLGVALLAAAGTTGAVASRLVDSAGIRDNSIRSVDVKNRTLRLQDLDASVQDLLEKTGATGPQGPPGPQGAPGSPGSSDGAADSIAATTGFAGPVGNIQGNSGSYVFAGPPATVTTTATHGRVTGSASAMLGLTGGGPTVVDLGLCYQPLAGGPLTNFVHSSFAAYRVYAAPAGYAAAATQQLAAGSYRAGMCVRNGSALVLNNNNYVNGWVQVTS